MSDIKWREKAKSIFTGINPDFDGYVYITDNFHTPPNNWTRVPIESIAFALLAAEAEGRLSAWKQPELLVVQDLGKDEIEAMSKLGDVRGCGHFVALIMSFCPTCRAFGEGRQHGLEEAAVLSDSVCGTVGNMIAIAIRQLGKEKKGEA